MKSKQSQITGILNLLKKGRRITPLDALRKFGCFRLGARIYDLRRLGYDIRTQLVHRNGKQFAEYSLVT